jgi:hypothetical protein
MSNIMAITYEGAATPTLAPTGTDAAGPFAGLWVLTAGSLTFVTVRGDTVVLSSGQVTQIVVGNGGFIPIATKLVVTGSTAVVLGLAALPYKPIINPGTGVVL